MSEVSFYHLQRQSLEHALPKLLERVASADMRAVVIGDTLERIEALNTLLWTYDPGSFLAHGTAKDGPSEQQPIYLTTQDENPNEANVLVLLDGRDIAGLADYDRVLDLFDGNDESAVAAARNRWAGYKEAGHTVAYWQQKPEGGWEQKG